MQIDYNPNGSPRQIKTEHTVIDFVPSVATMDDGMEIFFRNGRDMRHIGSLVPIGRDWSADVALPDEMWLQGPLEDVLELIGEYAEKMEVPG
jgi:hypothetical protein